MVKWGTQEFAEAYAEALNNSELPHPEELWLQSQNCRRVRGEAALIHQTQE